MNLTTTEKQLLELASNGLNNREIGNILEVSERTVKNKFYKLFKTIKAKNRAHAVALAFRNRIIN
jgi:DNA-binding CsgD family transcriptional regulator